MDSREVNYALGGGFENFLFMDRVAKTQVGIHFVA